MVESPLFIDIVLYTIYALLVAAVLLTVWSMVRSFWTCGGTELRGRMNGVPVGRITMLTAGVLLVTLTVTWLTANTQPLNINGKAYTDIFWLRISDMFIRTIIVLLVFVLLATAFNSLSRFFNTSREEYEWKEDEWEDYSAVNVHETKTGTGYDFHFVVKLVLWLSIVATCLSILVSCLMIIEVLTDKNNHIVIKYGWVALDILLALAAVYGSYKILKKQVMGLFIMISARLIDMAVVQHYADDFPKLSEVHQLLIQSSLGNLCFVVFFLLILMLRKDGYSGYDVLLKRKGIAIIEKK